MCLNTAGSRLEVKSDSDDSLFCLSPWLPARWRCLYLASEPQLQTQPSTAAWTVQTGPRPHLQTQTRLTFILVLQRRKQTSCRPSETIHQRTMTFCLNEATACVYPGRPSVGVPALCRRWSDISCRSDWTDCWLPGRRSVHSVTVRHRTHVNGAAVVSCKLRQGYSPCGCWAWTARHWASPASSHCYTWTNTALRRKNTPDRGQRSTIGPIHMMTSTHNTIYDGKGYPKERSLSSCSVLEVMGSHWPQYFRLVMLGDKSESSYKPDLIWMNLFSFRHLLWLQPNSVLD